jgi:predicted HicB family RNase H-like nuclease
MSRKADPNRQPHPNRPKEFSISARFPPEVFQRIHAIAAANHRSLNFVVNELVREGLDHHVPS